MAKAKSDSLMRLAARTTALKKLVAMMKARILSKPAEVAWGQTRGNGVVG